MFKLQVMGISQLRGKDWDRACGLRKRQRLFGNLAAVFLGIALFSMLDGLIAGMRQGSTVLNILPGQQLAISGPAAIKNPLPSDLIAVFSPQDCPLRFRLEGFFTGYWFGSGMWRGDIEAPDEKQDSVCQLAISFRGMSAKNTQRYEIHLFESATALQAASFSLLTRLSGLNAFHLASSCALLGLIFGLCTYLSGRIYTKLLIKMNLLTVYRPSQDGQAFLCIGPQSVFSGEKDEFIVFSEKGEKLGMARALGWQKGKWKLRMDEPFVPPDGSLVATKYFIAQL